MELMRSFGAEKLGDSQVSSSDEQAHKLEERERRRAE